MAFANHFLEMHSEISSLDSPGKWPGAAKVKCLIAACRPPSNINPANHLVRRLSSKNGWFPESIQPWSHHCYHSWVEENLWSASDWSFAFRDLMALNFGCTGVHVCSCPQVPESTAVASLRMPSSTHYYLNFLVLQWVTHGMNLTRYIQAGSGNSIDHAPFIEIMEPDVQPCCSLATFNGEDCSPMWNTYSYSHTCRGTWTESYNCETSNVWVFAKLAANNPTKTCVNTLQWECHPWKNRLASSLSL